MLSGVDGTHSSHAEVPRGQPATSHLLAACGALGMALLFLLLTRVEAQRQLRKHLQSFTAQISSMRMNGNVLQRAAFSEPDVLPVYGSSELDQPANNRPDFFFRQRPTGFAVFAEGHAGTTCLMLLQKIAAVGRAAHGKKTVVFLSPSWFARPDVAQRTVTANLPAAQVRAWVFDSPLRHALKQKLAKRLLRYPEATKDQPLLAAAVRSLSGRTWKDRFVFAALWPLGECQHQLSVALESGTLLWDVWRHPKRFRRGAAPGGDTAGVKTPPQELDWARLAARAESRDRGRDDGTVYSVTSHNFSGPHRDGQIHPQQPGGRDAEFSTKLRSSGEWHDLKLMAEVFTDLGVHAMFISQPINGKFYDLDGISSVGRQVYYKKLNHLVRAEGFPLRDYAGHEDDRFFFNDSGHPSAKAWIYYDEQLDRYYHEPPP